MALTAAQENQSVPWLSAPFPASPSTHPHLPHHHTVCCLPPPSLAHSLFSVLEGLGLDTDKEASGWAVEYVNPVDDITALLSGCQTTTTNFSIPTLSNTRVITGQSRPWPWRTVWDRATVHGIAPRKPAYRLSHPCSLELTAYTTSLAS